MSAGVNWKLLELQYETDHTYREEIKEMVTKNKVSNNNIWRKLKHLSFCLIFM